MLLMRNSLLINFFVDLLQLSVLQQSVFQFEYVYPEIPRLLKYWLLKLLLLNTLQADEV